MILEYPRPGDAGASPPCPHCGAGLLRIRRRWIDRLMSVFGRRRRYRCPALQCGWEGNLRVRERERVRDAARPQ